MKNLQNKMTEIVKIFKSFGYTYNDVSINDYYAKLTVSGRKSDGSRMTISAAMD